MGHALAQRAGFLPQFLDVAADRGDLAAEFVAEGAEFATDRSDLAAEFVADGADLAAEFVAERADLAAEFVAERPDLAADRADLAAEFAADRADLAAEFVADGADLAAEFVADRAEFAADRGDVAAHVLEIGAQPGEQADNERRQGDDAAEFDGHGGRGPLDPASPLPPLRRRVNFRRRNGAAGRAAAAFLLLAGAFLALPPGPAHAQTAQTVATDWPLIPSGLGAGDSFRLLFVTSTMRNAQSSNIGDYNSFVQDRADDGHSAIDSFSGQFRALISTASDDARDNTGTTGTGEPIYWLGGSKVADNYATFYDGGWDSNSPRTESGSSPTNRQVWTGSGSDGREAFFGSQSRAAGRSRVRTGSPHNANNEISEGNLADLSSSMNRLYGLSPVITVSHVPGKVTGVTVDRVTHNSIRVQWTRPTAESSTRPITSFGIDTRERNSTDTGWTNWDRKATPTVSFTSFTLDGLPSGTRQQVRVFARANQPGMTPPTLFGDSDPVEFTTFADAAPGKPDAPTVSATAGSTTSLDVSWDEPTNTGPPITDYDVQYRLESTAPSGSWTTHAHDGTTRTATIGSLQEGTSYQVRVLAKNAAGDGDWSDPRTAMTGAAVDTTAPVLAATDPATVNGAALVLTYDEALFTGSPPAAGAFTVAVAGTARTVSGVSIADNAVTLTLSPAVTGGQAVTVAYTKPATNPIQDAAGNEAATFAARSATNLTPGVRLSAAELTVAEGGTGTYTVVLTAKPGADVTVTVASGDEDVTVDTDAGMTGDQSALTFTATDWSTAQTVTVKADEDDDSTHDSATLTHTVAGPNGYAGLAAPTLTVAVTDDDPPAVESVAVTGAPVNGDTYRAGETIVATAVFAREVVVTGAPRLALTVGATRRYAAYTGISHFNGRSLVGFGYTVAAGDRDVNGIGIPANGLELNGGTITARSGGAAAVLDHAAAAAGSGHKVDGGGAADRTAPGLSAATVDGATLTLTFDEALDPDSVPAAGAFTVTVASNARTVNAVSVSGSKVTLTLASAVTHDQTVTVGYTKPTDTDAAPLGDATGNPVATFSGQAATNTTPSPSGPSITQFVFGADSTPDTGDTFGAGETIQVVAKYEPRVRVTGTPRVALDIGGATRYAVFSRGDSTLTGVGEQSFLSFIYTVRAGDRDDNGVSVAANSLELDGGTIRARSGGANARRTHAAIAADSSRKVDGGTPAPARSVAWAGGFTETAANDGSVTGSVTATLTGDTFTAGAATGTGVTVTNLPSGLTAGYALDSTRTVLTLTLTGNAGSHANADDVADLTVALADAAFTGGDAAAVTNREKDGLAIDFRDAAPVANNAPAFASETATRSFAENTPAGRNIGAPVTASDADGDDLTYALGGTDAASFAIVSTSGQLRTGSATYDFETKSSYSVTVTASDGNGGSDSIDVTITLTDVDETAPPPPPANNPPTAEAGAARTVDPGASVTLYGSGTDPDNDTLTFLWRQTAGPTVTLAGADTARATFTAPPDLTEDTALTFTLTVSDGRGGSATDAVTVTVRDLAPGFGGAGVAALSLTAGEAMEPLVLPEAAGGNGALTYALSSQPAGLAGLSFDAATRTLSGTPAAGGGYAFTWRADDADANRALSDAAVLSFQVTVATVLDPAAEAVQQVLRRTLAAVGTRTLTSALGNIGARFADSFPGTMLTLAGEPVPLGAGAGAADGMDGSCTAFGQGYERAGFGGTAAGIGRYDCGASSRGVEAEELFGSSAFTLRLGAAPGEAGADPAAVQWALWGRGDLGDFAGRPEPGMRYEGELRTAWLGFDGRAGPWVAGVALSHGESEADYAFDMGEEIDGSGRLETVLTAVYPYGRWTFGDGFELRGVQGAGTGEARHVPEGGAAETSDLSMRMASLGLRQELPALGGVELAARADASLVRMETGGGPDTISGVSADSWRGRVGLEASRPFALAGGTSLAPFVEAAGRRDGGDGLTGTGLEVAAGLRYSAPGVEVEARGRWLAAHTEDGARERGVSVTARVGPGARGRGLSLSLSPRWGAGTGAAEALWRDGMPRRAAGGADTGAVDARIGYGLALTPEGVLTPFAETGLAGDENRHLRIGTRFDAGRDGLAVELAGERREGGAAEAGHALKLDLRLRF